MDFTNKIIVGDAIEKMKELPDETFDFCFADPPYFMQIKEGKKLFRVEGNEFNGCNDDWDKFSSMNEYKKFTINWLKEVRRLLKKNGSICVISSMQSIYEIGSILRELGYWVINDIVWKKKNPTPNFNGTRLNNSHETLIWACKDKKSKFSFNYKTGKYLNNDKQMGSVWEFSVCSGNERLKDDNNQKLHNTQKPEALLYRIIVLFTNKGDLILDPFGGTMTTGVIAKKTGRNYTMIERDEKYVKYGQKRLDNVVPKITNIENAVFDQKPGKVSIKEMIDSGYFIIGENFIHKNKKCAKLTSNGKLEYNNEIDSIHKIAAKMMNFNNRVNAFDYFFVKRNGQLISIADIRDNYRIDHNLPLKKNNNFFSKKKKWSKIKDELLGWYLKPYFLKIISTRRPVVYVDCFAGKGKFDDGEDGSPLIALKIIDECIASSKVAHESISTYFIDVKYASDLETNLPASTNKRITNIIHGAFEEKIDELLLKHKKANVFLYIDPYGIKTLDIPKFKNILKKFELVSVEILINFNSLGFHRQACHILGFNDKSIDEYYNVEYDNYSVDNEEDMNKIFGSSSWKEIVCKRKNNEITANKAEIMLSKEFSKNLQDGFKYVLNIPIKSSEASIKYRMFYATNHTDGCILMADNMYKRSKNQKTNILNGKISLLDYDVDDKIICPESQTKNLLSLISNNEIEIRELLCNYFIKFGIDSDIKGLISILKKNENKLIIRRYPEKTNKGKKPTTFWFPSNGQRLFLRRM